MRCAISAHETCTVNREAHRQLLDCYIMNNLIVATLKEGGINRTERLVAF